MPLVDVSLIKQGYTPAAVGLMVPLPTGRPRNHDPSCACSRCDLGPFWFVFYGTRVALVRAHSHQVARLRFLQEHWPPHYPLEAHEVNVRAPEKADLAWVRDAVSDDRYDQRFLELLESTLG